MPPSSQTYQTFDIDDSDPAIVWQTPSSWQFLAQNNEGYNSTLHVLNSIAGQMLFNFTGTSIRIYGWVWTQTPGEATLQIDGGDQQALAANGEDTVYQKPFFDSGLLTNDSHHMNLTANLKNDSLLWIDMIQIETSSEDAKTFLTATPIADNSKHLSPGMIVLIALACAVTVLLAITAFLFWHRLRLRRPKHSKSAEEFDISPGESGDKSLLEMMIFRFKIPRRKYTSRRQAQSKSEVTASSTLFTSVIMPPVSIPSSM